MRELELSSHRRVPELLNPAGPSSAGTQHLLVLRMAAKGRTGIIRGKLMGKPLLK